MYSSSSSCPQGLGIFSMPCQTRKTCEMPCKLNRHHHQPNKLRHSYPLGVASFGGHRPLVDPIVRPAAAHQCRTIGLSQRTKLFSILAAGQRPWSEMGDPTEKPGIHG